MKVYIVIEYDYDYTGICGIYTDENKAIEKQKELQQTSSFSFQVEEYTVE